MDDSRKTVVVGRFGAAHGVKGYVRAHSFTQPEENLLDYQPWLVRRQRGEGFSETVSYQSADKHAKGLVVKMEGCDSREQAQLYTNCDIAIYQDQLPALSDNEYYWSDLIGLTVYNRENVLLGTVERLIETGSNDVLIVQGEAKQHYIPYILEDYVIQVQLDEKRMLVDWDENF